MAGARPRARPVRRPTGIVGEEASTLGPGAAAAEPKAVFIPEASRAFWFDLASDPDERAPRPLTPELEALFLDAHRIIDAHRTADLPVERGAMNAFPPWACPAGGPCRHPRTPAGGLFGAE